MIGILAHAILSAAGVVATIFVSRDAVGFPVYEMVVSLYLIAALAVIVWFGPLVLKAFFGPRSKK